jgi:hypothetical protein
MDLKAKAVMAVLQCDEDLYHNTRNPRYVWHAWQLARRLNTTLPGWVLCFVDQLAASEITKRARETDTADRYNAALTEMEVAVDRHRRRVAIRRTGKQLGIDIPTSRRNKPNLTAIARAAANANGVSANRLLARYRSSVNPPQALRTTTPEFLNSGWGSDVANLHLAQCQYGKTTDVLSPVSNRRIYRAGPSRLVI